MLAGLIVHSLSVLVAFISGLKTPETVFLMSLKQSYSCVVRHSLPDQVVRWCVRANGTV